MPSVEEMSDANEQSERKSASGSAADAESTIRRGSLKELQQSLMENLGDARLPIGVMPVRKSTVGEAPDLVTTGFEGQQPIAVGGVDEPTLTKARQSLSQAHEDTPPVEEPNERRPSKLSAFMAQVPSTVGTTPTFESAQAEKELLRHVFPKIYEALEAEKIDEPGAEDLPQAHDHDRKDGNHNRNSSKGKAPQSKTSGARASRRLSQVQELAHKWETHQVESTVSGDL